MQLRLNQGDMGVLSLKEKLLLDDMEGIRIAGSGSLHILATGEVKIAGNQVRVAGTGGVLLYEDTRRRIGKETSSQRRRERSN